jgi:DNA-binding beta-propeller fold protein YncE
MANLQGLSRTLQGFRNSLQAFSPLSGDVYITDSTNSRCLVFGIDGTFSFSFSSGLVTPYGIVIDGNRVYITDIGDNTIKVFTQSGLFVSSFGSAGTGDGQFDEPTCIAFNDTHLFVTDRGNSRVQKFLKDGTFVSKWGSSGTGNGQFGAFLNSIFHYDDQIFTCDSDPFTNVARVQVFDLAGAYQSQFGSYDSGGGGGTFSGEMSVCVDTNGVHVSDSNTNYIARFNVGGTYLDEFTTGSGSGVYAIAQKIGNLFLIEQITSTSAFCSLYESDGTFVDNFGSYGTGDGQWEFSRGVWVK